MLRDLGLETRRGGTEWPAGGVTVVQADRGLAWTKAVEDTGMRWADSRCMWRVNEEDDAWGARQREASTLTSGLGLEQDENRLFLRSLGAGSWPSLQGRTLLLQRDLC